MIRDGYGIVGYAKRVVGYGELVGLNFGIYILNKTTTNHKYMTCRVYCILLWNFDFCPKLHVDLFLDWLLRYGYSYETGVPMKAISSLFILFIISVVGIHGFFQVEYGTLSPCEAAVERIKKDKKSGGLLDKAIGELIGVGQEVAGKKRLATELEMQEGTVGCYQIALTGANK